MHCDLSAWCRLTRSPRPPHRGPGDLASQPTRLTASFRRRSPTRTCTRNSNFEIRNSSFHALRTVRVARFLRVAWFLVHRYDSRTLGIRSCEADSDIPKCTTMRIVHVMHYARAHNHTCCCGSAHLGATTAGDLNTVPCVEREGRRI